MEKQLKEMWAQIEGLIAAFEALRNQYVEYNEAMVRILNMPPTEMKSTRPPPTPEDLMGIF